MALRVLHLVGSPTDAFFDELSRLYASDCLRSTADPERYEPRVALVGPDRRWRFTAGLSDAAIDAARPMSVGAAVERIAAMQVDVMVPQMFCQAGMTDYRALFDVLDIPYVGNRPATMAVGADKAAARALVAAAGVAVPDGEVVHPGEAPGIAPPAVVKPVDADNSVGVTLVSEVAAFPEAVRSACTHGRAALVERYVPLGREVRAGIVVRDGVLMCLPLEEYAVDSQRMPIRDAADKLGRDGDGVLALQAKDPQRAWIVDRDDPICAAVWQAARRCHVALGCRHYSLFDFRIDPDGRPWFLEAGLYCSYARQSVLATMARAAGIEIDELFAIGVAAALNRPSPSPMRPRPKG